MCEEVLKFVEVFKLVEVIKMEGVVGDGLSVFVVGGVNCDYVGGIFVIGLGGLVGLVVDCV